MTAEGARLNKEGKPAAALDLYVTAYRRVQRFRPGSSAGQRLMGAMKHLARTYPAALKALEQLRDDAEAQLRAEPARRELNFEIALLNERLEQGERTLALFDTLPPDDIQRGSVAMVAREAFIKARRYKDALGGRPFGQMLGSFETSVQHAARESDAALQTLIRAGIVDHALTNIEVLMGAGKTDEARQLTEKLLAFDNTGMTRGRLEQHVARAKGARQ